jgi:hypothetical protein
MFTTAISLLQHVPLRPIEMQRTLEGACKSALHIPGSPSPMIVFRSDIFVAAWHS